MSNYPDKYAGGVYWSLDPDTHELTQHDDAKRFGKEFEMPHRVIAQEKVGSYLVSTVFLAIDHSHRPQGYPPVLFETMVFGSDPPHGSIAAEVPDYTDRYSNYTQAMSGHKRVVSLVKNKVPSEVSEM